MRYCSTSFLVLSCLSITRGQTVYPYIASRVAGSTPSGDSGPARSAFLLGPTAVALGPAGNVFIADAADSCIRQVAPDGTITTLLNVPVWNDLKFGPDHMLYYLTTQRQIFKVLPGAATPVLVAGSILGTSTADGGPAIDAGLSSPQALVIEPSGNVDFVDGNRIRRVTPDGVIHTIAGTIDPGSGGDNGPATSAKFNHPEAIAIDSAGNLYVADTDNYRIRKIDRNGTITTFAGGKAGQPQDGPALSSGLGLIAGLAVDASGNLYASDPGYDVVLRIDLFGNLKRIAGQYNLMCCSYGDTQALTATLFLPNGLAIDASGNVFIADFRMNQVRVVTPSGNISTFAGRLHSEGDGGAATSALLNSPGDVRPDGRGGFYIADTANYKIRRVAPDGTISTYAGNGFGANPNGSGPAITSPLYKVAQMAVDSSGALYFVQAFPNVWKISPSGDLSVVAGTGRSGNAGDGGPASQATFGELKGIALDHAGNVYVADPPFNRIRRINASDGKVIAWVGTGAVGFSADGTAATQAKLGLDQQYVPLAVDSAGNLYFPEDGSCVRKVSTTGVLTTVAGICFSAGVAQDGKLATQTQITQPSGLAFDFQDNLYLSSNSSSETYRISNGILHRIKGQGSLQFPYLGRPDQDATDFIAYGMGIDGNGDLYLGDALNQVVRKLTQNSPVSLSATGGDGQVARVGQSLTESLIVQVLGRAGAGVSGIPVTFAISSGSGTLSANQAQTDSLGFANTSVTVGLQPGDLTITATALGLNLGPARFTASAVSANSTCVVGRPKITAIQSAGDFGALSTFASGSWLEISGTNLSGSQRAWQSMDFDGANAPLALDGTSVSINGKKGAVFYVSASQINVQAPADPATGPVPFQVANCTGVSDPLLITKTALAPGLLAPQSFKLSGKQYLVALYSDGATYVGKENLIPGVPFRPAKPGDLITAYGIGFGDVSPLTPPGVVASGTTTLPALSVRFDQTPAITTYAGLAPGTVGLYQFNVVVPNVANGDIQFSMNVGAHPLQQVLFLTIQK
jgi:trimeric autotransporter adhesin